MAIDASLIEVDANKQNSTQKEGWDAGQIAPVDAPRAVREYLDTQDEAAFRAASEAQPKTAPHIPVFDKSGRSDRTWTRAEFEWDAENDQYICPEGHELKQFRRNYPDPNRGPTGKGTARYRALKKVR